MAPRLSHMASRAQAANRSSRPGRVTLSERQPSPAAAGYWASFIGSLRNSRSLSHLSIAPLRTRLQSLTHPIRVGTLFENANPVRRSDFGLLSLSPCGIDFLQQPTALRPLKMTRMLATAGRTGTRSLPCLSGQKRISCLGEVERGSCDGRGTRAEANQ